MVKTSLDWCKSRMDITRARAPTTPCDQEPSPAEALRRLQQHGEALQAHVTYGVHASIDGLVFFAWPQTLWAALRARLVLLSCMLSE
jgi:hypothetical protein